jgi:MSHA pilin protein MshC
VNKISASITRRSGFTLIELVMVIVLLSIVSAVALPKMFNFSVFQQRAFFDDMLNAVRYAQKLAIAMDCNVQVSVAGNQFSILLPGSSGTPNQALCSSTTSSDYNANVSRPGTGASSYTGTLSGLALSNATLYFYPQGNASASVTITVGGSHSIYVVGDTGFVYGQF